MKRIQIHIDEALDDAAEAEATRRGQSKAALIRDALTRELALPSSADEDPWDAMTGWFEDGGVAEIDEVVYGPKR